MQKKTAVHTATIIGGITLCAIASAAMPSPVEKSHVTWSASAGLGYDSNAYLSPSVPYVDYAALPSGSNPTVVPQVQSGFFVPLEMKLGAENSPSRDIRLLGSADLDGHLFLDSDLNNANVYSLGLRAGSEFIVGRKGKIENSVYTGIFAGKHKQVYFDRDSGTDKVTSGGANLSERYSYTSTGVEAEYKHRTGRVDYGLNGKYARNDYEDPVVVSQLDHILYKVGAELGVAIARPTKLGFAYHHTVRDYSDRHSRNAQGVYSSANPLLLYTYEDIGVTLRQRVSTDWVLHVDYDRTQRADDYVAYNDYNQNKYGARVLYANGRFKGRLALEHWTRDYPNAFAFDEAALGTKKTYDGNTAKLKAEWEQTKHISLWGEAVYRAQNSTDLRYEYDRNLIMVGMSWAP